MLTPCDLISCANTANKIRSMLVFSWSVSIGRVRHLTSRNHRSTALLVRTARRSVLTYDESKSVTHRGDCAGRRRDFADEAPAQAQAGSPPG
jgi:hypothetical protein